MAHTSRCPRHSHCDTSVPGLIKAVFEPASFSMPPTLVPRNQLAAGNALYRMGLDISRFVAAPLAGALIAGFGAVPAFALNAVSFFQAAGLEAAIRPSSPKSSASSGKGAVRPNVWQQTVAGLAAVREDAVLTGAAVFSVLWYLGFMGVYSVGLAGLAQIALKTGPQGQGILLGAFGIGNLAGSLAAGNIRNFGNVGLLILRISCLYIPSFVVVSMASGIATGGGAESRNAVASACILFRSHVFGLLFLRCPD